MMWRLLAGFIVGGLVALLLAAATGGIGVTP